MTLSFIPIKKPEVIFGFDISIKERNQKAVFNDYDYNMLALFTVHLFTYTFIYIVPFLWVFNRVFQRKYPFIPDNNTQLVTHNYASYFSRELIYLWYQWIWRLNIRLGYLSTLYFSPCTLWFTLLFILIFIIKLRYCSCGSISFITYLMVSLKETELCKTKDIENSTQQYV